MGKIWLNIQPGLKVCGIVPFNKNSVSERVPHANRSAETENHTVWFDTIISYLTKQRSKFSDMPFTRRGRKLKVIPGKSISIDDVQCPKEDELKIGNEKKECGRYRKEHCWIRSWGLFKWGTGNCQ